MQDPNPELPPQGGQYIPPPSMYQPGADIPADSPHHYSPAPSRRTSGGIGAGLLAALAAAWAYGKYALLFLVKFKAFGTLISLLISFGGYALFWGPWFAAALIVMIFVHEMGHVVEIAARACRRPHPYSSPSSARPSSTTCRRTGRCSCSPR